ncbi:unnamed protein product [Thelazia callipaeda]|uniref:DOCKER domain-containing protein n=1 Tax=Thelazia callipaeda TaxID=103827 RepID=A0A0N5D5B5_THECL|nr:unnamed protein product [Thelazia callipaeda]
MDVTLLSSVVRAVNHASNDVKCTAALGVHHIASRKLSMTEMKEKNNAVRAACQQTLLALFKLRNQKSIYEEYLQLVEGAARSVLVDAYRTLQRVSEQPDPGLEPLLDIANVP